MTYAPAADPLALADHPDRGRISVYAQGADYHDIVKKALKAVARWLVAEAPGAEVKVFVDSAPVMEKPLAAAAGLGWQRSEEHTSELQSLMRISYTVFCLKTTKDTLIFFLSLIQLFTFIGLSA